MIYLGKFEVNGFNKVKTEEKIMEKIKFFKATTGIRYNILKLFVFLETK